MQSYLLAKKTECPPLHESLAQILGKDKKHRGQEALTRYRQRYDELGMYENILYPGILSALESLAAKGPLYVATSKPIRFADKIIRHFGLNQFFKKIFGSELDGRNSNKAELIATILRDEKLNPDTTIMIGDREHDMIGAVKNGIQGVGVLWGYGSREELLAAGALSILSNPSELTTYF